MICHTAGVLPVFLMDRELLNSTIFGLTDVLKVNLTHNNKSKINNMGSVLHESAIN